MKIDIAKFGLKDVPVNPDSVFTFPQGLVGFEDARRFTLFHEEGKPTVFWLQSLDDPQLAFSVVPPESIDVQYEMELSDEDAALIDLKDPAEVVVVVVLYRQEADNGRIAANTRSPLVLNTRSRLGMQKILREFHPTLLYRAR
ncbi:flagellar assembly protein FliW [Azospira restricta]|uniref:Flagellar assembly factor FliW n=1 Tax=Azospira restricta TaxID=404405 RepID=A0A974SMM9_9RHOO|nr:flagellar assembly protein FliW [Azospira restricta]QRJ62617.1 flagellar assembly protein FliW [Azospira restricta]